MNQHTLRLLNFSFCVFMLWSCSKEKIEKMDKGKYELTHIRTFDNGVKDTFQFYTYGPDLSEDDISFYPGV